MKKGRVRFGSAQAEDRENEQDDDDETDEINDATHETLLDGRDAALTVTGAR